MIAPPPVGNMLLPGLSSGNPSLEEHSTTLLVLDKSKAGIPDWPLGQEFMRPFHA